MYQIHQDKDRIKIIKQKILGNILDTDVENYIYELNGELLCSAIISDGKVFANILLKFMKKSEERSLHIIQSIEDNFRDVCNTWESHDPIASFAYSILMDNFSFVPKELAAKILRYIARETNRYNAQRLIESAIATGIEPTLEDILNS
jgi:eukaryotic-like serine/threonine-protein kinase